MCFRFFDTRFSPICRFFLFIRTFFFLFAPFFESLVCVHLFYVLIWCVIFFFWATLFSLVTSHLRMHACNPSRYSQTNIVETLTRTHTDAPIHYKRL